MKIKNESILERNYRKLWWLGRVNEPFRYAARSIRKKWYSQKPDGFEKVNSAKTLIEKLEIATKLFSEEQFEEDILNLAKEFDFEDFWKPYLTAFIITGKIFAPAHKLSKNTPPPSVWDQHKIFLWTVKKWSQLKKLQKKGYKTKRKNPDSIFDSEQKYISELPEGKIVSKEKFVHADENIADRVFGKGKGDIEDDTKRVNRVKQARTRLIKQLVELTPQYQKRLDKLFS